MTWMDTDGSRRRSAPRAPLHYECTLRRRRGTPVVCTTLDLGPGGMCVTTDRPLTVDEVLSYDLPIDERSMQGQARVLREQGFNVYALRFETIPPRAADLLDTMAQQTQPRPEP